MVNVMRTQLQSIFKMHMNSRETHLFRTQLGSCVIIWEVYKPSLGRDPEVVSYGTEPYLV